MLAANLGQEIRHFERRARGFCSAVDLVAKTALARPLFVF
jgi:hypothetical protein